MRLLQSPRLIRYRRWHIEILDRPTLEGIRAVGIPRAVGEPDCNKMDYPLVLEGPHKSTACDTLCRS